jgi:hypothetical protein
MLNGKFENPMLGIFGAHLLLLKKQLKLNLLSIVVRNLRRLLGENQHPDVEALALRLGKNGTFYTFEHLPMLRRSWWQVVDATVDNEELVPLGSMAAKFADRVWGQEPWLQWMTSDKSEMANQESEALASGSFKLAVGEETTQLPLRHMDLLGRDPLTLATSDPPMRPVRSKAVSARGKKSLRGRKGKRGKPVTGRGPIEKRPRHGSQLKKSELRMMVSSSGLPRASVQALFNQYEQTEFASRSQEELVTGGLLTE